MTRRPSLPILYHLPQFPRIVSPRRTVENQFPSASLVLTSMSLDVGARKTLRFPARPLFFHPAPLASPFSPSLGRDPVSAHFFPHLERNKLVRDVCTRVALKSCSDDDSQPRSDKNADSDASDKVIGSFFIFSIFFTSKSEISKSFRRDGACTIPNSLEIVFAGTRPVFSLSGYFVHRTCPVLVFLERMRADF